MHRKHHNGTQNSAIRLDSQYVGVDIYEKEIKLFLFSRCLVNSKRAVVHSSPTDNIMFILYDVSYWILIRITWYIVEHRDPDARRLSFQKGWGIGTGLAGIKLLYR